MVNDISASLFFAASIASAYILRTNTANCEELSIEIALNLEDTKLSHDSDDSDMDTPSSLPRNDSDFSLGMSRSKSLAEIAETNFNALGLCSTGRISIEITKFVATGLLVVLLGWKILEETKPKKA